MYSQIILRVIAAATADFINLLVKLSVRPFNHTTQSGSDRASIRLCPDALHLDPIVPGMRVAAQQLRYCIRAIGYHIHIAVIVEVTEGASTIRRRLRDTRATLHGHILEMA